MNWGRWWRTLRHLKLSQLGARLMAEARRRFPATLPPVPAELRRRMDFPRLTRWGAAPFIEADLAARKWHLEPNPSDRLAAITVHYHLWATLDRPDAPDLLRDWRQRCLLHHLGPNSLAWNSYAVATRIVATCQWLREWDDQPVASWRDLAAAAPGLIWQHAHFLSRRLEWDLRANHLFRDAVGLAAAGRFFEGCIAQRWWRTAMGLACAQIGEQILPDGGHFERSPGYHQIVMHDLQTLCELAPDEPLFAKTLDRMRLVLRWMTHPDGTLARFNDSADNDVEPAKIPTPSGGRYFPDTGWVAYHGVPWSVFFDVGPLGPEFQPGHGHADTLTVETSFNGTRLVVDPGTFGYDANEARRYDRGTAAHNVVCVDGMDSSEMWHRFRVGRREHPCGVRVEIGAGGVCAEAAHDGYAHLPGRPMPWRRVEVSPDGVLRIHDEVRGTGRHHLTGGWLVDPAWRVICEPTCAVIQGPAGTVRVEWDAPPGVSWRVIQAPWHPAVGVEILTQRLQWDWHGELPLSLRTWWRGVSGDVSSRNR